MLHPYLFLGLLSRPWTSYCVEDGEAAVGVWLAGTKRVVVSASHIDIAQDPLQKLFGLGDLVFRGDEGAEIMRWRNLRDVNEVRKRVRDAGKSGEQVPAHDGDSSRAEKRSVFRNPTPQVWGRPRPVVLPEALKVEHWPDAGGSNQRLVKRLYMAQDGQRLGILTVSSILLVEPTDGSLLHTIAAPFCVGLALSSGDTLMAIHGDDVILCDAGAEDLNGCRPVRIQEHSGSRQVWSNVPAHPYQIAMSADGRWFATHANSSLYVGEIRKADDGSIKTSAYRSGERASVRGEPDYLDSDYMVVHPKGEWVALSNNKHSDRTTNLTLFDPRVDGWFVGKRSFPSSVLNTVNAFLHDRFAGRLRYRESFCAAGPPPDFELRFGARPTCHAIRTDAEGAHIGLLVNAGGHQFLTLLRIQPSDFRRNARRQADSKRLGTIDCGRSDSRAFALSPDARLAATAGEDAEIRIWDTTTLYQVCELTCHGESAAQDDVPMKVDGLAFHPNWRWLFSAERSGIIRRWTLTKENGKLSAVCDLAVEALPEGHWVVWEDPDGPNRCWGEPSDEAKRWLGWRVPSGEYQTFDAF